MKIWKMENELNGFESFQLSTKDKIFLKEFRKKIQSGINIYNEFSNIEIEIIDCGKKSDLPKFWTCSSVFLFSEQAKNCLEYLINDCVEFIPVKHKDVYFYLMNIISIVNAIDYSNASFRKLSTGLVVGLDKYCFVEKEIKGLDVFMTTLNGNIYSTEVFVTSEFKNAVEQNNLQGFKFIEVWDSDK